MNRTGSGNAVVRTRLAMRTVNIRPKRVSRPRLPVISQPYMLLLSAIVHRHQNPQKPRFRLRQLKALSTAPRWRLRTRLRHTPPQLVISIPQLRHRQQFRKVVEADLAAATIYRLALGWVLAYPVRSPALLEPTLPTKKDVR